MNVILYCPIAIESISQHRSLISVHELRDICPFAEDPKRVLVKMAISRALHTSATDVRVYAVGWVLRNPTKL